MEKPHPVVGADPLEVVRHFIERCGTQTLMRRYRLPNFVGAEGFLEVTLVVWKKMPQNIVNSQVEMIQMKWRFLGKSKVGLEFEIKRRQKKVFFGESLLQNQRFGPRSST